MFAHCDVGVAAAVEILRRALPLGSMPRVFDVLRVVLPDGAVLEKTRTADPIDGKDRGSPGDLGSTGDRGSPGDRSAAVRARWFPPAYQLRSEIVCA